ncbi:MAG: hypothetical protein AB1546_02915 [bacterium]
MFSPVLQSEELMIQMEASESPPKGVKQMAEEMKKAEEQKKEEEEQAARQAAALKKEEKPKREKVKYPGVFNVLSPLAPIFPLKSGNIKGSFMNLANNGGGSNYTFRRNFSGGFFLESNEQDLWKLEKVTGKIQYNRQLRNSLNVNSMTEWAAKAFGLDFKYNRTVGRTGSGAGASASQNVTDTRKFSAEYKIEKGLTLSYNIDQIISRAISASPTKTNNKKQTWSLVMPLTFREGTKLTLTHANTGNWNITGNSVTKVLQTDAKLDVPLKENFELNLAYQFLGNRNIPQSSAATSNRKSTRSIGMSYKFSEESKLTYLYNFSSSRNFSTVFTNFNTTNRALQFERALSKTAKMKLGNTTTFDQSAGKTAVRTGSFSYDHKDFDALPGSTSIDIRKQFTSSAGNSNTNYTMSVNTPLSYIGGRLTTNLQNVLTVQNNLASSQRTRSVNQTLAADYKFTDKFSIGTSLNRVKSGTFTPATYSARSVNHIRTDKATYDFGKRLNFTKSMEGVKYNFTITRNSMRNEIPTPSVTLTRVRKHSMNFSFKGSAWKGKYDWERSLSLSSAGQKQRVLQHKFDLSFEDFLGCQFTANYTGAFQRDGSQVSTILKLTEKVNDKKSYFLSWETLRNKSRAAGATKTRNRYFELGVEITF